jgi:hypothetical protein
MDRRENIDPLFFQRGKPAIDLSTFLFLDPFPRTFATSNPLTETHNKHSSAHKTLLNRSKGKYTKYINSHFYNFCMAVQLKLHVCHANPVADCLCHKTEIYNYVARVCPPAWYARASG